MVTALAGKPAQHESESFSMPGLLGYSIGLGAAPELIGELLEKRATSIQDRVLECGRARSLISSSCNGVNIESKVVLGSYVCTAAGFMRLLITSGIGIPGSCDFLGTLSMVCEGRGSGI